MIKTLNFWCVVIQFLSASAAHVLGFKTLFYWSVAWCMYSVVIYLCIKEEN